MKKILIIHAGPTFEDISAVHGEFYKMVLDGLGTGHAAVVDVEKGESLPDFRDFSGAVMTGSHSMVTEKPEWSENTAKWINEAANAGLPFLGICYGHQLLASALGGEAGYHPAGMEIGTVDISLLPEASGDDLFGDMPADFSAHAVHSQTVTRLPDGAVRLAYNSHDPNHAFRYKNAWGVQFHPEFSADVMRGYIKRQCTAQDVDRVAAAVAETPEAAGLLRKFAYICLL